MLTRRVALAVSTIPKARGPIPALPRQVGKSIFFGKLTNAKRRSKALYLQSLEYEQAVSTSLIANVANLYYTLLMLDEQYRISEETAASWRESVRTMRAMMAAGMTNEASVSQSKANCRQVEASLLDLRQQVKEVENSLSILLGDVPGTIERGRLAGQEFPQELAVAYLCNCFPAVPM